MLQCYGHFSSLYGNENWVIEQKNIRKIQTVEANFVCKVKGCAKMKKTTAGIRNHV